MSRDTPAPAARSRGVRSVEVGLSLLDHCDPAGGTITASGLVEASGLSRSQVHAYLVSLTRGGLLERDTDGGYRIGPLALALGLASLRRSEPPLIAARIARHYTEALRQSITISVWGAAGPTVTSVLRGNSNLRTSAIPGNVYSVTGTASGLAFAAWMPPAAIREIASLQGRPEMRQRIIGETTGVADFPERLEQVRRAGCATTRSWPQPGLSAIAVPAHGFSGEVELVLSLNGPDDEIDPDPKGRHVQAMLELGSEVSRCIGGRD